MIASFADKVTAAIWTGRVPKKVAPELAAGARRKLRMIDAATSLSDLASPPGNRLELLSGDRAGQHSIRVNAQWRLTFVWRDGAAHNVKLEDYH